MFIHDLQDHYRLHILDSEIIKTDSREINSFLSETRYSFHLKPDGLNAVMNYKGRLGKDLKSANIINTNRTLSRINKTNTRRLQIINIKNNHRCVWTWFMLACMYWPEHFYSFCIVKKLIHFAYFVPGNVANNANIVQFYLIQYFIIVLFTFNFNKLTYKMDKKDSGHLGSSQCDSVELNYVHLPHTYLLPEPLIEYKFVAFPITLLFVLNSYTVRIILLQYCHDWIIFYVYILVY